MERFFLRSMPKANKLLNSSIDIGAIAASSSGAACTGGVYFEYADTDIGTNNNMPVNTADISFLRQKIVLLIEFLILT